MESDRFDRWAKVLARRMSRRSALTGLGAASVASLMPPRWAEGQEDDEQSSGRDRLQRDTVHGGICEPVTRCKLDNGLCTDVGPLPGGPYPQRWVWTPVPGCTVDGPNDLKQICNTSYADECRVFGCVPGIDNWAIGCR
jgi:hypothetical protein